MSFILFSESFGKTKCNARKRLWSGKGREGLGKREKEGHKHTDWGDSHMPAMDNGISCTP